MTQFVSSNSPIFTENSSMPLMNGIETLSTVDLNEVDRLKAQGWIVERSRVVLQDIVCYDLVRLS